MQSIKPTFPATSKEAIDQFEASLPGPLPAAYRQFLLDFNGGKAVNDEFAVEGWGSTGIQFFFGLDTGWDAYNLDWQKDVMEDILPDGIIAIATDSGGFKVCLGVDGPGRDKIYFYDREGKLGRLVKLAPDFDTFLNGLKPGGTFES